MLPARLPIYSSQSAPPPSNVDEALARLDRKGITSEVLSTLSDDDLAALAKDESWGVAIALAVKARMSSASSTKAPAAAHRAAPAGKGKSQKCIHFISSTCTNATCPFVHDEAARQRRRAMATPNENTPNGVP